VQPDNNKTQVQQQFNQPSSLPTMVPDTKANILMNLPLEKNKYTLR
jgi:hypothetical protein